MKLNMFNAHLIHGHDFVSEAAGNSDDDDDAKERHF